jgi:hypothetical protein
VCRSLRCAPSRQKSIRKWLWRCRSTTRQLCCRRHVVGDWNEEWEQKRCRLRVGNGQRATKSIGSDVDPMLRPLGRCLRSRCGEAVRRGVREARRKGIGSARHPIGTSEYCRAGVKNPGGPNSTQIHGTSVRRSRPHHKRTSIARGQVALISEIARLLQFYISCSSSPIT